MKPRKHCELIKAWDCYGDDRAVHPMFAQAFSAGWDAANEYRIKPERKRYRVAQFKTYVDVVTDYCGNPEAAEENVERWESYEAFVKWLTDWIEYD